MKTNLLKQNTHLNNLVIYISHTQKTINSFKLNIYAVSFILFVFGGQANSQQFKTQKNIDSISAIQAASYNQNKSNMSKSTSWQNLGNDIFYNGGNVGIGINPTHNLHVNGNVFLEAQDIVESWLASYFQWTGHRLIMGSPAGTYFYNSLELRPGGSSRGTLLSQLQLYSAIAENQQELKISLNSEFDSFINAGNVGIGTSSPTHKLDVRGTVRANEVIVNTAGADFVFADDYSLRPLKEVEQFITENKHLPDIAPADSMVQNGVGVSEMQIKLLQKIEELTLYVIEQEKRINELVDNNQKQNGLLLRQQDEIEHLKEQNKVEN